VELSRRQRRALEQIADTFAPGLAGLPPASAHGVVDEFAHALERFTHPTDRAQLLRLLSVWDLVARRRRRFGALGHGDRERVLRAWRDSRIGQRRAVYKALRKGVLSHYYGLAGAPRDALGYPGALPSAERPCAFEPIQPAADTTLSCDVCVVGSGAGGGTAAGVLARAGLDVVVIEAGGAARVYGEELEALRALYLDGATSATADQSLDYLAGACLGGGTWVNWTTSFHTPDDVRAEWAAQGVPAFTSAEFDRSLDAVWTRMDVNCDHGEPSARDRVLERGLTALGWHVAGQARNTRGCDQGRVCGYCGFGCALGAKQTTVETWLQDAVDRGARVLAGTRARRVVVDSGAAVGVEADASGSRVEVRSRGVVVACGAIHTPALLRRSGLASPSVGRTLHVHPVTLVTGDFDEEIRPWEGTLQARYSEEHARLDDGYGVRYETPPVHPTLFGAALPWDGAHASFDLARRYPHLVPVFPLVRDRDAGEVRIGRDGEPRAHYRLSSYDLRHLRAGFLGAARILEAAGARRIVSTHARPAEWRRGHGTLDDFMDAADAAGWGANRVLYASAHLLGTARMGGSPAASVCDPSGETWEVARLVIADGSACPTATGVNPMISIAAIAHMNASALASRLS
jgi:choline dehydrogenase-like flavoprotein